MPPHNQQVTSLQTALPALILEGGKAFVLTYPRISATYVLGLLLCVFATGLTPSPDAIAAMERAVDAVEAQYGAQLTDVSHRLATAEDRYHAAQGFLWSCDARCLVLRGEYEALRAQRDHLTRQYVAGMAEANAHVGIFSVFGVQQARSLFWDKFGQGKEFAKRQSLWDAVFVGIGSMSRDETVAAYGVRMVMSMLFNFTLGMIGAVVAFMWNLWGLISAFGADLLTGAVFFGLAAVAAVSFCVSWILGLVGAVAGSAVALAAVAGQGRLEGDGPRRRRHLE